MNVKDAVLFNLEQNRGQYVSGESIAEKLNVTRQAVSKAINALKSSGFDIVAVKNRGYKLLESCDTLSAAVIEKKTGARTFVFESVPSTGKLAAGSFFDLGECIVVANEQTDGKKNDGGNFYSPRGKGIYFSFAIPLCMPFEYIDNFRKICKDAVAEIISISCGKRAYCEDMDEVLIDGKKVSGIMVECFVNAAAMRVESAVVGIGIYTSETCFSSAYLSSVFPDDTRNNMIADIFNKIKSGIQKTGA